MILICVLKRDLLVQLFNATSFWPLWLLLCKTLLLSQITTTSLNHTGDMIVHYGNVPIHFQFQQKHGFIYTVVKVDGTTPKRYSLVRGHDKAIHGSCAIYFPGGVNLAWQRMIFCYFARSGLCCFSSSFPMTTQMDSLRFVSLAMISSRCRKKENG